MVNALPLVAALALLLSHKLIFISERSLSESSGSSSLDSLLLINLFGMSALHSGSPFALSSLIERRGLVGSKEVSVMILSPHLSSRDSGNPTRASSESVINATAIELPSVSDHKVKVGVVIDRGRDVGVVLQELFLRHFPVGLVSV